MFYSFCAFVTYIHTGRLYTVYSVHVSGCDTNGQDTSHFFYVRLFVLFLSLQSKSDLYIGNTIKVIILGSASEGGTPQLCEQIENIRGWHLRFGFRFNFVSLIRNDILGHSVIYNYIFVEKVFVLDAIRSADIIKKIQNRADTKYVSSPSPEWSRLACEMINIRMNHAKYREAMWRRANSPWTI